MVKVHLHPSGGAVLPVVEVRRSDSDGASRPRAPMGIRATAHPHPSGNRMMIRGKPLSTDVVSEALTKPAVSNMARVPT